MILISFFGLPTKLLCCRVTNSSVDKMLLFLFSSKQQPSLIGFELLEFLNNAATCSRTRRSHPHTTLQITHLPTPLFFFSNFLLNSRFITCIPFPSPKPMLYTYVAFSRQKGYGDKESQKYYLYAS